MHHISFQGLRSLLTLLIGRDKVCKYILGVSGIISLLVSLHCCALSKIFLSQPLVDLANYKLCGISNGFKMLHLLFLAIYSSRIAENASCAILSFY